MIFYIRFHQKTFRNINSLSKVAEDDLIKINSSSIPTANMLKRHHRHIPIHNSLRNNPNEGARRPVDQNFKSLKKKVETDSRN